MTQGSDATVVIACHTEDRWAALCQAVESAQRRTPVPAAIVVAVDHNPGLLQRIAETFPSVLVTENAHERGASGTRNTGARQALTSFVAFLDDDASARNTSWLAHLTEPFVDQNVVGTGGFVAPAWEGDRPNWFPDEFAWVVGASFRGLPKERAEVRNVWSENMAVRREVFEEVGGFRVGFGKVGNASQPEDTELCMRMGKARKEAKWLYIPDAIVDHRVGPERAGFGFFLRRSFAEGRGKVELARFHDQSEDLDPEWNYLRRTLPSGFARSVRSGVTSRQLTELLRAGAICAGVAAAGAGGAVSFARGWRDKR